MKKILSISMVMLIALFPLFASAESDNPYYPEIYEEVHEYYEAVYGIDLYNPEKTYYLLGYIDAYELFLNEEKTGRYNSNAIHEAEKLLLGKEIYEKTEGKYSSVKAEMNKKGVSGTPLEAYDILFATYRNENGEIGYGYGIYELISFTKGYSFLFREKDGKLLYPHIQEYMIEGISNEWGMLNKNILRVSYYAFTQYFID